MTLSLWLLVALAAVWFAFVSDLLPQAGSYMLLILARGNCVEQYTHSIVGFYTIYRIISFERSFIVCPLCCEAHMWRNGSQISGPGGSLSLLLLLSLLSAHQF